MTSKFLSILSVLTFWVSLPLTAQPDSSVFKVFFKPESENLANALYYDEAVQNINVELRRISYNRQGEVLGNPIYMYFSKALCNCWVAKVEKSANYQFRVYHPGFEPILSFINARTLAEKTVYLTPPDSTLDSLYAIHPVTGIFGLYPYVAGARPLTETLAVVFASGPEMPLPSENKALLEGDALAGLEEEQIVVRQVSQMGYAKNAFFVTLGLPDRRNIDFFMYFKEHGGKIPPRGDYLAGDIFKAMKTLMAIENVEMVSPTFFSKRDRDHLAKEQPRLGSLQAYYHYHKNKKHYDGIGTSRKFKRMLGDLHYDYEEYFDK